MFKYNLGQTVFYMRDNRINSAMIASRSYSDEATKLEPIKKTQYSLAGNWLSQDFVFATVDDINYFLKNNIKAN